MTIPSLVQLADLYLDLFNRHHPAWYNVNDIISSVFIIIDLAVLHNYSVQTLLFCKLDN